MKFAAFLGLMSFLIGAPAKAEINSSTAIIGMTGNQLYERCTTDATVDQAACLGYILGVVDANWIFVKSVQPIMPTPPGVTGEQLRAVVIKDLENHPEGRHLPASFLIYAAMKNAFRPQ